MSVLRSASKCLAAHGWNGLSKEEQDKASDEPNSFESSLLNISMISVLTRRSRLLGQAFCGLKRSQRGKKALVTQIRATRSDISFVEGALFAILCL